MHDVLLEGVGAIFNYPFPKNLLGQPIFIHKSLLSIEVSSNDLSEVLSSILCPPL